MRPLPGFTLIEIMIVLAIVGVLAAVAYPSYQAHVFKTRRADAIAALHAVQLAQEKWRASHTAYATLADLGLPATSADGYYALAVSNLSATTYTVTATPRTGGPQVSDTACSSLVLTQDGPDLATDAKKKCWSRS
ncbi:MAG: prepilin-type N-terminal cleavage/methylation domain-containing protein [Pseudomonadota bacterium]|nr:prepilin-type N-terminal cleavage/methylation domain-containing protein [Pseudomonadota bacterium]